MTLNILQNPQMSDRSTQNTEDFQWKSIFPLSSAPAGPRRRPLSPLSAVGFQFATISDFRPSGSRKRSFAQLPGGKPSMGQANQAAPGSRSRTGISSVANRPSVAGRTNLGSALRRADSPDAKAGPAGWPPGNGCPPLETLVHPSWNSKSFRPRAAVSTQSLPVPFGDRTCRHRRVS